MVVPIADSAAWQWQISLPHHQEPLQKGLAEGGVRGFTLIWLTGREKIITRLNNLFSFIYSICAPYRHQNDGITPPLCAPAQSNLLYIVYSPMPNIFSWLLCDYSLIGGRLRPLRDSMSIIFCLPNRLPNSEVTSPHAFHPPCATSPISLLPRTSTFSWLLCLLFKFRPL